MTHADNPDKEKPADFYAYMEAATMCKDGEDYTVILRPSKHHPHFYEIEVWDTSYRCVHQRTADGLWEAQQLFMAAAMWYGTP